MQSDSALITSLNEILMNELTAINQYFLHAKMHLHWGYTKLANKLKEESIDEMKHADILIERILQLEGLPNLQQLGKLMIGEHPIEALECDLKLEHNAISVLREVISRAEAEKDYVTRSILLNILENEEKHVEWLETQLRLTQSLGEKHYLLNQM